MQVQLSSPTLLVLIRSSNTVKECKQHELAENFDDEKKIYKAEARAARNPWLADHQTREAPPASSTVSSQQSAIPTIISRGSLDRGALASQKPSPGACFACGKNGHWRASCPLYQNSSSAAGKQWLVQDDFEGEVFSLIYCLSRWLQKFRRTIGQL